MSESKRVSEPDDIVTRLRQWSLVSFSYPTSEKLPPDLEEAADEIERLRKELDGYKNPKPLSARHGQASLYQ